ncbi:MAG: sugar ABC transporter ATP-binding protein [Anaerolineaceae bacterium]|nr:sugar ABC transporter ATP-binding protein [Anaerolineaceae bacterium]
MNDMKQFLSMKSISKRFVGVQALDEVDLEVNRGEVLALVGENGAGKSTLMNVLGGVVINDSGSMLINGKLYDPRNPRDAREVGVSFIHQELTLFPSLTVGENIFVNDFPKTTGFIDHSKIYDEAEKVLDRLGVRVNARALVRDLSVGDQQLVEIGKAVFNPVQLIIFDEPTSSLTKAERDCLFNVIRGLKAEGTAVIYISHFLNEVFEISDRISVMRDGKNAGSLITSESHEDEVITLMVGRQLRGALSRNTPPGKEVVLNVEGVSRSGFLEDINFSLHRGEILGIWGLLGSGRTELARTIFGLDPIDSGKVILEGEEVQGVGPVEVTKRGIGYLTESRRDDGLILGMCLRENVTLSSLDKVVKPPFSRIIRQEEETIAEELMKRLRIVASSTEHKAENLSGGNQQKLVLAKWLASEPKVFILDEPTRGVDVGAKDEIHRIILSLVEDGASVILISSEMEEIMRLSDRILVMHRGKIRGEVSPETAKQEDLVKYTTGGN